MDNDEPLENLFDLLCEDFKRLLENKEMTASDRKTLLEFFRDNNVNCVGKKNKSVKSILDELPFEDEEDELKTAQI